MESPVESKSGGSSSSVVHVDVEQASGSTASRGNQFSIEYILSNAKHQQRQAQPDSLIDQLSLLKRTSDNGAPQTGNHLGHHVDRLLSGCGPEHSVPMAAKSMSSSAAENNPNFLYFMACMLLQQQQQNQRRQQAAVVASQQEQQRQTQALQHHLHQQQQQQQQQQLNSSNNNNSNNHTTNPIEILAQLTANASTGGGTAAAALSAARSGSVTDTKPADAYFLSNNSTIESGQRPLLTPGAQCYATKQESINGAYSPLVSLQHALASGSQPSVATTTATKQRCPPLSATLGSPKAKLSTSARSKIIQQEHELGIAVRRQHVKTAHSTTQATTITQTTNATTSTTNHNNNNTKCADSLKPAHSYIGLIGMCILSTPEKRMVLNDIYQYILDHYPYYRNRGSGWRNSVRHNLSLNECFQKAGRAANGKGHYWTIHPANMDDFMNGDFRRRRAQRKVRRWNNMDVPSDESDDESTEDANRPPLPEHFKRSLEMHRRLEAMGYAAAAAAAAAGVQHQQHEHAPMVAALAAAHQQQQQHHDRMIASGEFMRAAAAIAAAAAHQQHQQRTQHVNPTEPMQLSPS